MKTLLALVFLGMTATVACAGASVDGIRERGVLRVGVKTDAPPFGWRDARGRQAGFEADLARFFARVLFDDERRAEFVPVTTQTRFDALAQGRVDLVIATVTATAERRGQAELSDAYFNSASLLLVRRGSPLRELADAAGRRVAVVDGSIQQRDLAELGPRAIPAVVESVAAGVRGVRSGLVEAFLYDDVVLLGLAQADSSFRVTGAPIRPRPYAVAARKGDTELIRWVNGWLARMHRDGSYTVLWRRYFQPFESRLVGG
jgi:ABC-type amino acid transport substrate-binding protein